MVHAPVEDVLRRCDPTSVFVVIHAKVLERPDPGSFWVKLQRPSLRRDVEAEGHTQIW